MKILYIECNMGAAGDMLTGALTELLPDKEEFVKELNSLGIPGVEYCAQSCVKAGITGTYMKVSYMGEEEGEDHKKHHHGHADHDHPHENEEHENMDLDHYDHMGQDHHHDHEEHENNGHDHHHTGMHEIEHIVRDHIKVSDKVKKDIMAVYGLIAQAESHAHNRPVNEIHFHEVGMMDAIADITAVCLLMEKLSPDRVVVSHIHVGSGQVKCAHGILPVPAPATVYILRGVPIYGGSIDGELCTPTGAALLKYFADEFSGMPLMLTESVGYGMGKKDFEAANCVRAFLGHSDDSRDTVFELNCNVDDMTGEDIGYAVNKLLEEGALEVYTTAVGMKKSRPGTKITVLCRENDRQKMVKLIFRHTSTLGIRESECERYVLDRVTEEVNCEFGTVRKKTAKGYGVLKEKYEYDDLVKAAEKTGRSLNEIRDSLKG
jgi:hypothetical protein